jgi:NADH dehydrogenase (ubiquinone) Fe-S protein 6
VVDGDLAVCEGGGGALGHPVEYITLKASGSGSKLAGICKYCNLRYVSSGH